MGIGQEATTQRDMKAFSEISELRSLYASKRLASSTSDSPEVVARLKSITQQVPISKNS